MEDNKIKFKVRDKRNRNWFFVDNEYLNGFGEYFGAIGISIYVNLCRHANEEQKCFPSEETIGEELHLTDRTVRKYLKLFKKYRLIEITKERSQKGKWLNNTYWLLDKSGWIQPKEIISDGKTLGNKTQNHRKMTTEPEETNNSLTIPIKKNTNKKNTNKKSTNTFSSNEDLLTAYKERRKNNLYKKPYFMGDPMRWVESERKWYVIDKYGEWLEFAGQESEMEWK